jgi:hypothetical protein
MKLAFRNGSKRWHHYMLNGVANLARYISIKSKQTLMGKNLVEDLLFETSDYPCSRFRKAKENNGDKG